MSQFPSTTIDTPVGRLHVWATSGDHVGIRTEGYADGTRQRRNYDSPISAEEWETIAPSVKLSRVDYLLHADLHPRAHFDANLRPNAWNTEPYAEHNGWTLAEHGALLLSRVGRSGDYTLAAKKQALRDVFVPLCEWIASDAGAAFLAEAARGAAESERASALARLESAREAVAAAEAALAALTGEAN